MIELNGKNNKCVVFTDNIDGQTIAQLINLLNQDFVKNSQIRIMPDCHTGKGCVIGTTMTIQDKVVPNLVGSDIGCGVLTVKLMDNDIDFKKQIVLSVTIFLTELPLIKKQFVIFHFLMN